MAFRRRRRSRGYGRRRKGFKVRRRPVRAQRIGYRW